MDPCHHWIPQNSLALLQLNCYYVEFHVLRQITAFPNSFDHPIVMSSLALAKFISLLSSSSTPDCFSFVFSIAIEETKKITRWTVHHSAGLWTPTLIIPGVPQIILKFLGMVKKRENKDKRVRPMFPSENSTPP